MCWVRDVFVKDEQADESVSSLLKSNRGGFVVLFDPSWRPASVAGFACLSHAYIDAARGQDELLIFGRFDGHLEEFADIAGKYECRSCLVRTCSPEQGSGM
jgi:hypothetical protein